LPPPSSWPPSLSGLASGHWSFFAPGVLGHEKARFGRPCPLVAIGRASLPPDCRTKLEWLLAAYLSSAASGTGLSTPVIEPPPLPAVIRTCRPGVADGEHCSKLPAPRAGLPSRTVIPIPRESAGSPGRRRPEKGHEQTVHGVRPLRFPASSKKNQTNALVRRQGAWRPGSRRSSAFSLIAAGSTRRENPGRCAFVSPPRAGGVALAWRPS